MSPLGNLCPHGAMTPTAAQLAYHYAALHRGDQGAAAESCIDWCGVCTGIALMPFWQWKEQQRAKDQAKGVARTADWYHRAYGGYCNKMRAVGGKAKP